MGIVWQLLMVIFIFLGSTSYAQQIKIVQNNKDGSQTLLNHVPQEVALGLSQKIASTNANQSLDLRIILSSKDQAGLDSFISQLYNPKSSDYHKFLTSAQFDLLYGASSVDSTAVSNYLKSNGFKVISQSKNGLILSVSAPVSVVESFFKLNINNYKKSDGTVFFAPDANPTIPTQIAGKINAVAGMDNVVRFHPHFYRKAPAKSANKTVSPAVKPEFSGPNNTLEPKDFLTAYNLNSVTSTGVGQTLALYELDGYTPSDITTYETMFNLPNMTLTNVYTDGATGTAGVNTDEDVLDIDLSIAVAPGLSKILVYEAPNTGPGWIDQWNKIAEDDLAGTVSCSWGEDEAEGYSTYDHTVFAELAAQGQTVFASSGDAGAYDNCDGGTLPPSCVVDGVPATGVLSVDDPASDPYITSVGISVLTANNDGSYNSETASLYGGGGISSYWPIPSFQQGLTLAPGSLVSTTMRNVPDVVFTADPATSYYIYVTDPVNGAQWYAIWGSSAASPIWAAYISRVNQGRVASSESVLGYLNPVIYQIAQGSNYNNNFHDITSGTNSYYPAETGYDDATGLGSFNGANLYNNLVGPPATPTGLVYLAGNGQVELSWTAVLGAASYNVKRATVNGGLYSTIASVTVPSYIDNGLINGDTYYYVVSAVNGVGESPNSLQISATPHIVPITPTNLKVTILGAKVGNTIITGGINLTWTQSTTPGVTKNKIYRAIGTGPYTLLATLAPSTSYVDKNVSKGTVYLYVVTSVSSLGESLTSNLGWIQY